MTFDGADRSNCTVRRQATSTPLQSLALLNDVQFVEASRMLAQQLMTSGTAESEYGTTAFRIVTGRTATDAESAVLSKLYQRQKSYYTANPGEARKLLTTGDKPADAKLDPAALAAATMVCQALLNHDEAVNCR
jgi:hypothetical protein